MPDPVPPEPFDPEKFLAGKTAPKPDEPFDPGKFLGSGATAPPAAEPIEQRGIGERLAAGFMDPFYGMAQVGARMTDPGGEFMPLPQAERDARIAAIDKQIKEREEAIQKRSGAGIDWWRLIGQAGNPVQYLPALTGGLAGAGLSGMTSALMRPTTDTNDFVSKKLQDAAIDGAIGTGVGAIVNVAGKAVSPIVGRVARNLLERGVELTPGRLAGGLMSRMEDAARSIPWLGQFVRQASDRSLQSYNIAAINQALDPIAQALPASIPAGRQAVAVANDLLSNAYDNLLTRPGVTFSALSALEKANNFPFLADLARIKMLALELPENFQKSFLQRLDRILEQPLAKSPTMSLDGRILKDVESQLGYHERLARGGADPVQKDIADLFARAKEAVRDALERQNPAVAGELQDINHAYAMFKRIQAASTRRAGAGAQEGVFTPMDLAAAVKAQDPSKGKASYARGDALMQEFAEWGQFLLPQKLPDSGTTERSLWGLLGIAGTGAAFGVVPAAKVAAGGLAASIPWRESPMRIANRYARAADRPWRQSIRAGVQAASPFVGGVAATPLATEAVPAAATQVFDAFGNLISSAQAKEGLKRPGLDEGVGVEGARPMQARGGGRHQRAAERISDTASEIVGESREAVNK